ncbi:MAG: tetratricopeptide repeat protein [Solirubrobacterales bacterium]|jgi:serine/threonine-protein kinase
MSQPLDRQRWPRVSAVLEAALERPEPERAGYLDEACAGDAELRRQVEELLAADAAAGSFLAMNAVERAAPLVAEIGEGIELQAPALAGERIVGAYRLLSQLGEGGMGVVYLAERVDGQFEHQVAVKLLKQGLHGEDAGRRFLQERQILARLQHPGIARLLDGGVTAQDSPFFVMERVEGRPVTAYCDEHRLGIEQRLRVFLEICDAVQYAHRSLVVHRDLKPSNILVDAAGRVKLLDFGIAKLLAEGSEDEAVASTRTALRAMTPEYAAPEQVRGDPVTTATDVYTLGVLLYELLTGERPYRVGRGATSEVERAVLEQEPTRPSARTAGAAGLPGIRRKELQRRLRGDLDGIVLRALQKEPERRYSSAEAMATDVRRHLGGLPVSARGDGVVYRAFKFVRRHRVAVAAVLLVLLSMLGGLVGTAWQARRAQREALKAEAVKDFLKSLFSASDPAEAQGKEVTARALLENGARRIEKELQDQPEVQSEVARLIAATYLGLGEHESALGLLRADLERRRRFDGPRSGAVAESLTRMADVLYEQGQSEAAGKMYDEALEIQRKEHGDRSPEVAALLWSVASVKGSDGDYAGAEEMNRQALALFVETRGDDSREAAQVRNSLEIIYTLQSRLPEAAAMGERVAEWGERHDGPDHPDTLQARFNYAYALLMLGQIKEALAINLDVLARQRRVLGDRHTRLALTQRLLARALDAAGRSEDALPPIAEALAIHRERFGPTHPQVAMDLAWQAMIEAHTARLADGERDAREALRLFATQDGIAPVDMAWMRLYAGIVLGEAGRLEEADGQLSQAVAFARADSSDPTLLGRLLDPLGDVARRRGQAARAAEVGSEALQHLQRFLGADHPVTLVARVHAGAALWAAGRADEGEPALRVGTLGLEQKFPDGSYDLATAWLLRGEALARSGRPVEARPFLERALEWRQAHLGPADPRTVAVRRILGPPAS